MPGEGSCGENIKLQLHTVIPLLVTSGTLNV